MFAYPLSIKEFSFKKPLVVYITITMFFNGGLIPTFLLMRDLHLMNTFTVMVLPFCVSAWNVIIYRTFFQSIPAELRESAFLDGANDITVLFRIVLPLSKPLLATFALFSLVATWNSWFNALLYLTDSSRYPVQMVLRRILLESDLWQNQINVLGANKAQFLAMRDVVHTKNIMMASVFVVMLPILTIYPFVQKYFAKGMMIGAIKG